MTEEPTSRSYGWPIVILVAVGFVGVCIEKLTPVAAYVYTAVTAAFD